MKSLIGAIYNFIPKLYEIFYIALAGILNFFLDFKSVWKSIEKWVRRNDRKILTALVAVLMIVVSDRIILNRMLETPVYAEEPEAEEVIDVPEEVIDPVKEEAEYVARVLYGTARYNSERGQQLVVWCVINRTENDNYPDTIRDVCRQKDQWMGYSDDNPVMQDLYDISYEILSGWHNGSYRAVSPDFIFMKWTPDQISLKTEFTENKSCRFIYE